jgi:hypothetical protein
MPQILRNHTFVFVFVALYALISVTPSVGQAADSSQSDGSRRNAIGVCAGVPQTISLTYERALSSHLAARVHVGSVVLLSSAGARLQWQSSRAGLQPYFFGGGALIHAVAEDYGNPEGTAAYIWLGPGVNLSLDRWMLYTEVSALLGGDDDKGLGDDWIFPFSPAITVGILVRL